MSNDERVVYQHTQIGYVTGGALIVGMLIAYYSFMAEDGALGIYGYVSIGIPGVLAVLFSSLTVTVTDQKLAFYFGPGFWERKFLLPEIISAKVVRNSPLAGWGIRRGRHGWLYNVSGLDAVELQVKGEGKLRIGTDEPTKLKRALEEVGQPG